LVGESLAELGKHENDTKKMRNALKKITKGNLVHTILA